MNATATAPEDLDARKARLAALRRERMGIAEPDPPLTETLPRVPDEPDPGLDVGVHHAAVEAAISALKIEAQARLAEIPGRLAKRLARYERLDPDTRIEKTAEAVEWADRRQAAVLREMVDGEAEIRRRAEGLLRRQSELEEQASTPPPEPEEDVPLTRFASEQFALARRLRMRADLLKAKGKPRQVSSLLAQARQAELAGAMGQQEKIDLVWADKAIDETARLAELRGEEVAIPTRLGAGRKPARRVTGIEWLLNKNRLDPYQHQAAERYEADFATAASFGLPSCLREGGGGGDPDKNQARRMAAQGRLDSARKKGLKGHPGMVGLCDQVCGLGFRLRAVSQGDEAQTQKNEAILLVALDLLVEHYGIL